MTGPELTAALRPHAFRGCGRALLIALARHAGCEELAAYLVGDRAVLCDHRACGDLRSAHSWLERDARAAQHGFWANVQSAGVELERYDRARGAVVLDVAWFVADWIVANTLIGPGWVPMSDVRAAAVASLLAGASREDVQQLIVESHVRSLT